MVTYRKFYKGLFGFWKMKNDSWLTMNGEIIDLSSHEFRIEDAANSLYFNFPLDVAEGIMDDYRSTIDIKQKSRIEEICEDCMSDSLNSKSRRIAIAAYRAGNNEQRKYNARKQILDKDGASNKKKYIVN